jgi:hypothetical protein
MTTLLVGPGDVGKRIKVLETARDVRSDESEQTAAVSYETSSPAVAWPAGSAPRVDLIRGTPEGSTSSTREQFVLSPSHANPADGAVQVACALDGGLYAAACATSRSFVTPTLGIGTHSLHVKATNGAGANVTTFRWSVVAPAPPVGCTSCFHPPHLDTAGQPMTWDWQLSNAGSSLIFRPVDLFDIDGFNNLTNIVATIHGRAGRTLPHEKAICYISLGSWENFRADATAWPKNAIGQPLQGFGNEHWVDVRQLSALQPIITSRLNMCAAKGFDGVEVDNIDGWDGNNTGFPLTAEDTQAWLTTIANQAHALNMFILWKNDPYLASFGARYFDGALSEQCYSYGECTAVQNDGTGTCNLTANPCGVAVFAQAGKWVGEVEYPPSPGQPGVCTPTQTCAGSRSFTQFCNTTWRLPPNGFGFAAWRAIVALDGRTFYSCWN